MSVRSALILALLLVAPLASAAWSAKGAREPDTGYDLTSGLLPLDPDTSSNPSTRIVYFNGFLAQGGAATTLNPNVATLETRFVAQPPLPVALLGIWKDCNNDGFVGLGDNGLVEYPSALLLDTSVCPPSPEPPGLAWASANDGQWVIELVPIGYDDITTPEDEDPVNLNDTGARVWADWGLPGAAPGLSCPTTPAPVGTFRSTGGLLRYLDCFTGFQLAAAITAAATAAGQPALGFGDAPPDRPDRSASPLNVANPWGDASDAPMASAFDCASTIPVVVADPTGDGLGPLDDENGDLVATELHSVAPAIHPDGSPAGTVNETEAGATDCDRTDRGEILDTDGRQAGSDGDLPYLLEGPSEPVSPFAKRSRTDHALGFEEGVRGVDPTTAIVGARGHADAALAATSITGFWVAQGAGALGRNPFVSRASVAPEPVLYITFYAHVSPVIVSAYSLRLPVPIWQTYGNEGCFLGTFDCDPDNWWRDAEGNDITPRDSRLGLGEDPTAPSDDPITRIGARMGDPYELRDTDCYDSSATIAREAGAQWGALTSTACA